MKPSIRVTETARAAIADAAAGSGGQPLRIAISDRFDYDLRFSPRDKDDVAVETGGVTIVLDPSSASRADGMTVDFSTGPDTTGFSISNPNQPPRIRQMSALELRAMIDSREPFELVDVRTPEERAIAVIPESRLLDQTYHDYLLSLDRETVIVFQCHHGMRSQAAAEYFQQQGFRHLHNLQGGIDAWSQSVDPGVVRY
jgi:monothiol glutaredoxin